MGHLTEVNEGRGMKRGACALGPRVCSSHTVTARLPGKADCESEKQSDVYNKSKSDANGEWKFRRRRGAEWREPGRKQRRRAIETDYHQFGSGSSGFGAAGRRDGRRRNGESQCRCVVSNISQLAGMMGR